jgi:acetate kinase
MKRAISSILTINGGSSSIKFALFQADETLSQILAGRIEGVGFPQGSFTVKSSNGAGNFSRPVSAPDHMAAVNLLMDWVQERIERDGLTAVGHRVVHGGKEIDFICE